MGVGLGVRGMHISVPSSSERKKERGKIYHMIPYDFPMVAARTISSAEKSFLFQF